MLSTTKNVLNYWVSWIFIFGFFFNNYLYAGNGLSPGKKKGKRQRSHLARNPSARRYPVRDFSSIHQVSEQDLIEAYERKQTEENSNAPKIDYFSQMPPEFVEHILMFLEYRPLKAMREVAGKFNQAIEASSVLKKRSLGILTIRIIFAASHHCYLLNTTQTTSIGELKKTLMEITKIPQVHMGLIWRKKLLENNKSVDDYEISDNARLNLIFMIVR
jgi:hypothetical protein